MPETARHRDAGRCSDGGEDEAPGPLAAGYIATPSRSQVTVLPSARRYSVDACSSKPTKSAPPRRPPCARQASRARRCSASPPAGGSSSVIAAAPAPSTRAQPVEIDHRPRSRSRRWRRTASGSSRRGRWWMGRGRRSGRRRREAQMAVASVTTRSVTDGRHLPHDEVHGEAVGAPYGWGRILARIIHECPTADDDPLAVAGQVLARPADASARPADASARPADASAPAPSTWCAAMPSGSSVPCPTHSGVSSPSLRAFMNDPGQDFGVVGFAYLFEHPANDAAAGHGGWNVRSAIACPVRGAAQARKIGRCVARVVPGQPLGGGHLASFRTDAPVSTAR